MNIIVEQKQLEKIAGKALEEMIRTAQGKPLLLLLSGGSSLKLLEYISADALDSQNLTVGMLDDRYSRDPGINSYKLLELSGFYLKGLDKGVVFLDSSVEELETLETYAARYEDEILKWMTLYPEGIIRATVGIGPDGHTSGILPFPEDPQKFAAMFNAEKLIVGYDVENKNIHRYRMTSTFTLMRKFDQVITYMTGWNKADALKKVMAETGDLATIPGRIIRELRNVTVYTDIQL